MASRMPKLSSGYAFVSVACSEQVMLTDSDIPKFNFCRFVVIDGNEYALFRHGSKVRLQLRTACELTQIRLFTADDISNGNHLYVDRTELVDCPLWYHKAGLQQTSSGYGSKLVSSFKIWYNGRLYRLYVTCYGNSGSSWFISGGRKIFVS